MYAHGRDRGGVRLDVVPKSVAGREADHQLSCSWNGDDVDEEKVTQELEYSASGFAPASDVPQRPSRHSSESGLLDDTRELRYCEQIEDRVTP